jgi:hypothetical protein
MIKLSKKIKLDIVNVLLTENEIFGSPIVMKMCFLSIKSYLTD